MEDAEERLLGSRPLNRLLLRLHRKQLGRGWAQLLLGGGLAAGVCLWRERQMLGPGMSENTPLLSKLPRAAVLQGCLNLPAAPPGHRATSPCHGCARNAAS